MIHPESNFTGLNVTINTTEDCNLRCKYCYETCKSPKSIEFETCKKFIDLLASDPDPCDLPDDKKSIYDAMIFDFIGGDSLMDVDLLDRVFKYITYKINIGDFNLPKGYKFSISSNGTLFELPKVRDFCERWSGSLSLGVSIDGCPEIHDMNRVYPDGRGSMSTIVKWWPWYREKFPNGAISTKSTCSRNSIPYLYDSLKFMHEELGIKYINQNFIMEDMGCTDEDWKELDKQFEMCIQYILDHRHDIYWSMIGRAYSKNQALIQDMKDKFTTHGWCGSGCMPALSIDGNIYPCFRWLPHTQNGQVGVMCVGNVDEGFIHKENFKKVSEGAIRANCTKEQKCIECDYESTCPYCIGGCYAEFGDFIRTTYICEVTKLTVKWSQIYWDEYYKLEGNYGWMNSN